MSVPTRILLVEDDELDAQLALAQLREGIPGCSPIHVDTVAAAVGILGGAPFDAILLDMRLPDGCGRDALDRVRRAAGETPIVVLTSVADDELAVQMVSAGAEDYLVKGRLGAASLARVLHFAARRRGRAGPGEAGVGEGRVVVGLVGRVPLLLEGLAGALRAAAVDTCVVGPVVAAAELRPPEGRPPDVVIIHAPGERDGGAAEVRVRFADARIVLLARDSDRWLGAVLDEAAADALLPDTSPAAAVVAAVQRVLDGEVVLPVDWRARRERDAARDPLAQLSGRQREVLLAAAAGRSNSEIAEQLFITVNTVKFHMRSAYGALGIHNRVQAARVVAGTLD